MKMKKRWIFAAFVAIFALAMVGCGGDDDDGGGKKTPVVTSVTVTATGSATAVEAGDTLRFSAAVAGTNSPATTVIWSIDENVVSGTGISTTGLLTVDSGETATELTVRATSTVTASVSGFLAVAIVPAGTPIINTITVSTPDDTELAEQNGTLQFTATVAGKNLSAGNDDQVTWEVVNTTGAALDSGTSISTSGLLTIGNEVVNTTYLKVTATTTLTDEYNDGKSGTKTVQVVGFIALKFYDYQGGSLVKTVMLPAEVTIENAGKTLARPPNRGPDYAFKEWVATVGGSSQVVTVNSSFFADTDIFGTYYDGVFRGDTSVSGTEKVYLENQAFVVYEFDLSDLVASETDKNAAAIDLVKSAVGITAQYGLSEAAIAVGGGGARARVLGPYFLNDTTPVTLTSAAGGNYSGDNFYGDFKGDPNGKPTIRLDGTASDPVTFNKWHGYMVFTSPNANWQGWTNASIGDQASKDIWFDQNYQFDRTPPTGNPSNGTSTYGNTMAFLEQVFIDGKHAANGTQILDYADTDFTKVYFAIGIARANAGSVVNTTNSIWDAGRVQMIRNVKLLLGGSFASPTETVNGTTPDISLPAHNNKNSSGADVVIPATPNNFKGQVFAGYINPVIGSWRGSPSDTVAPDNAPGWVAPTPPPDAQTHVSIILNPADIKLYGDAASPNSYVTKDSNGVVSVDITVTGGGYGITLDLPTELLQEYSWEAIWIDYDADIDPSSGDRAQFASKGGRASWSPNLTIGNNAWPSISDGEDQRFVISGTLASTLIQSGEAGVSFQINNNAATNVPQKYTIKFKKIVLRAP